MVFCESFCVNRGWGGVIAREADDSERLDSNKIVEGGSGFFLLLIFDIEM